MSEQTLFLQKTQPSRLGASGSPHIVLHSNAMNALTVLQNVNLKLCRSSHAKLSILLNIEVTQIVFRPQKLHCYHVHPSSDRKIYYQPGRSLKLWLDVVLLDVLEFLQRFEDVLLKSCCIRQHSPLNGNQSVEVDQSVSGQAEILWTEHSEARCHLLSSAGSSVFELGPLFIATLSYRVAYGLRHAKLSSAALANYKTPSQSNRVRELQFDNL